MLKAFTVGQAGKESGERRSKILARDLGALGIDVRPWPRDAITSAEKHPVLILAHDSELMGIAERVCFELAESGGYLVIYTMGQMELQEERRGEGKVFHMRWPVLREVIAVLPRGFDLKAFDRAVETVRRRSLLSAVAILMWCITVPTGQPEMRQRQSEWREDRSKWLDLFDGYTRLDFLRACGVAVNAAMPENLAAVGGVLDWLWPSTAHNPPQPDLALALHQLEERFGLKS